MDLVIIYRALMRKKWLILGATFGAVMLALLLTINYQSTYKSTAQLATGFTVAQQVSVTNENFNLYEAEVKFNNLIETLKSPGVFSLLSYRLLLHDLDRQEVPFRQIENKERYDEILAGTNVASVVAHVQQKLSAREPLITHRPEDFRVLELLKLYKYDIESLKDIINITRVAGTDYISLVAYTELAELSAFSVNTLVDAFLTYNRSIQTQRSTESIETFQTLVQQKRVEMETKSEELRNFKSSNSVLNFQVESSAIISQITELESKMNEAARTVQAVQLEIESLNNQISNAANSTASTSSSALNAEILTLKERISDANTKFVATGSNNEILLDSLRMLRSILQQKLTLAGSGFSGNATMDELVRRKQEKEIEHKIARQNVASIERNLRLLRGNAGGFASKEAAIAALERELQMATQEYRDAQEKYNRALDVALASGSGIRLVLQAQPAVEPEPSKRLIVTALAGVSIFVLCVMAIVFLEYIDISVKTPSGFRNQTDLKQLGILLSASPLRNTKSLRRSLSNPSKSMFQFNKTLRKLRYEIESSGLKTFLITSTQSKQGKTMLILALASALGSIKRKVLIIDTNFSNNDLTKILGAKPILEEIAGNQPEYTKAVTNSVIGNTYIIGSKGGGYSPSDVLSMSAFATDLQMLQTKYDYIFLEGGSLNNYSDSKELEQHVQGIIAVFSAKAVLRQIDRDSIAYLKSLKGRFLGAVLNEVESHNIDQ